MIRIQRESFNSGTEITLLRESVPGIGALASFTGFVRDMSDEESISTLTLEHYPGMTERLCSEIESEAHKRWPLQASLIIHRYGILYPNDPIVLVVTASAHRKAALNACHFLIDWLKTKAPFWKQEETPNGPRWVEARPEDEEAAQSWTTSDQKKT